MPCRRGTFLSLFSGWMKISFWPLRPWRVGREVTKTVRDKQDRIQCILSKVLYRGGLKKWFPGFVNFVPAVACHFCLNLPVRFLQPGNHFVAHPCKYPPIFESNLRWNGPILFIKFCKSYKIYLSSGYDAVVVLMHHAKIHKKKARPPTQ